MGTMKSVFERIIELLEKNKVQHQVKEHPPTYTSEESAWHRGEPLKIGAKAMILKTDRELVMAVLPADRKIDSSAIKKMFNSKNLRLATLEELKKLTGLVPGSVPPFGSWFDLLMIVDNAFLEEEYMAFNAGSLEKSIKMKTQDYIAMVAPRVEQFTVKK